MEYEKLIGAAKLLKEYCNTTPSYMCHDCIFFDNEGRICVLNIPQDWDLPEVQDEKPL